MRDIAIKVPLAVKSKKKTLKISQADCISMEKSAGFSSSIAFVLHGAQIYLFCFRPSVAK